MELVRFASNDYCVACIVSAVEAHDHVGLLRVEIDDFSLAFVAPLKPYDYYPSHKNAPGKIYPKRYIDYLLILPDEDGY